MSRSIHRLLLLVSLTTVLLLAGPAGAAPSPPAVPDSQASPSLLDSFLTYLTDALTVGLEITLDLDASGSGTSTGGTGVGTSGSCIDPLGCPK